MTVGAGRPWAASRGWGLGQGSHCAASPGRWRPVRRYHSTQYLSHFSAFHCTVASQPRASDWPRGCRCLVRSTLGVLSMAVDGGLGGAVGTLTGGEAGGEGAGRTGRAAALVGQPSRPGT